MYFFSGLTPSLSVDLHRLFYAPETMSALHLENPACQRDLQEWRHNSFSATTTENTNFQSKQVSTTSHPPWRTATWDDFHCHWHVTLHSSSLSSSLPSTTDWHHTSHCLTLLTRPYSHYTFALLDKLTLPFWYFLTAFNIFFFSFCLLCRISVCTWD